MVLFYGAITFAGTVESFDNPTVCTAIRLDQNDGPFAKIPIYNQALETAQDTNICYAITAAQLIDAYRIKNRDRREFLTSPFLIALRTRIEDAVHPDKARNQSYNDLDPITFLVGGGSIAGALSANKNRPACDQNWLENFTKIIHTSSRAKPADNFLLDLASENAYRLGDFKFIESAIKKLEAKCAGHEMKMNLPSPEELKPPEVSKEAYLEFIKALESPDLTKEERKKIYEDYQKKFGPKRKMQLFGETIHRLLEQSSGVGIGYFYKAVERQDNRESAAEHASLIVGRRFNKETQKCEFLVRDSYGPNCQDSKGQDRYHRPCENGSIWVEARSLLENTMHLTWIP